MTAMRSLVDALMILVVMVAIGTSLAMVFR